MSAECVRCKANNPDEQRFCGQCGNPLDPALLVMKGLMSSSLREEVGEIIKDHYKDQKIVEVETTAAIAAKLSEWAKLFAFFVGIPIALFLLLFGVLGIRTYSDSSRQVEASQSEITTLLRDAQSKAERLKSEGDSLAADYVKLRAQLGDTKVLSEQVAALSKKVDDIGARVGFTPTTSIISAEQKNRLLMALDDFRRYLRGVGYKCTTEQIDIDTPSK